MLAPFQEKKSRLRDLKGRCNQGQLVQPLLMLGGTYPCKPFDCELWAHPPQASTSIPRAEHHLSPAGKTSHGLQAASPRTGRRWASCERNAAIKVVLQRSLSLVESWVGGEVRGRDRGRGLGIEPLMAGAFLGSWVPEQSVMLFQGKYIMHLKKLYRNCKQSMHRRI